MIDFEALDQGEWPRSLFGTEWAEDEQQRAKPNILHPIEPEDALAGLLKVKPEKEAPMPNFKPNDKVTIKLDADQAPEEARGKEGIVMVLDPSHIGFRSPGSSYETANDGAIVWQVHFPELGKTLPIHEVWLDHI